MGSVFLGHPIYIYMPCVGCDECFKQPLINMKLENAIKVYESIKVDCVANYP